MAAGHTEACRGEHNGMAVRLDEIPPQVDARDEEIAELRRRCALYAGAVRRLLGALRDVERVNVAGVLGDVEHVLESEGR
jgi:hypothetical protein